MDFQKNDIYATYVFNQFVMNGIKLDNLSSDYSPDFACVGFPKCATTFILDIFAEYSFDTLVKGEFPINQFENYLPKIKEIHNQGKKVAIKNPGYIYQKNVMDQLQRSGCKIIISVRNPVRWLKSFYNYRIKRIEQGLEHLPTRFNKIPNFGEIVHNDLNFMGVSVNRGMMAKIITGNLLKSEYYDPSRVLFVIQEEFELEHDKVQTELLDFLGIPTAERGKHEYIFEYNSPKRWEFYNDDEHDEHLYNIYSEEIKNICSLIKSQSGKDLISIWEGFYKRKFY